MKEDNKENIIVGIYCAGLLFGIGLIPNKTVRIICGVIWLCAPLIIFGCPIVVSQIKKYRHRNKMILASKRRKRERLIKEIFGVKAIKHNKSRLRLIKEYFQTFKPIKRPS